MRIKVLGPIEITDDGRVIRLAGPAQRALVAALALDHGTVVPVGRLTEILWGDRPPATARTKIQAHVSAVRQAMGRSVREAGGPLLTVPPGYLLSSSDMDLDLAEFYALTARGTAAAEAGDPAAASALLGDALALWRGPAFADVSSAPVRAAAECLDEHRLLAAETKAEADLTLGRTATVVAELSVRLISHPFRERSRGLLMLALDRLGCRAEALRVYRAGYQVMLHELGVAPGPWLRGLYERIMDGAPPSPATAAVGGLAPAAQSREALYEPAHVVLPVIHD
jgi:DNA-binding SARP family transcriptional activator